MKKVMVVPVAEPYNNFADQVKERLRNAGYYVDVSVSDKTMNKRIAEASVLHYNYIVVVGEQEEKADSVNVRPRPKSEDVKFVPTSVMSIAQFIAQLDLERDEKRLPADQDWYDPNAKPVVHADGVDENEYAV